MARLSYQFGSTPSLCLKFWYHMSGTDIGWLSVYHLTDVSPEALLWSMDEDQGEEWKLVQINLRDSSGNLPTQVRGVIGLELSLGFGY